MRRYRSFWTSAILPLLLAAFVLRANGQDSDGPPAQPPPEPTSASEPAEAEAEKPLNNFVESGGSYETLSGNYSHWSGGYVRGVLVIGKNTFNAEVNGQHEFGDAGTYMAAGDTYNFSEEWYGALTIGSSIGGFFWPRFRADGFANRKWRSRKQFITTAGFGYYVSKDVHRDSSFFLGTTYHFDKPWIIEDGIRFNFSNPGAVFSPFAFIAVTQGRNKQHYLTLNCGFGQEGYQLVGPSTILTRFPSQSATLTWRQWMGRSWGFDLVADFYHSPYYHRGGGTLGLFKEF